MKQTSKERNRRMSAWRFAVLTLAVILAVSCLAGCGKQKEQPVAADEYPAEYQKPFSQVWQNNHDFKGYLTVEGSALSTVVVQGADNSVYTQKGFDGAPGKTPFLDYRADVMTPGNNLLIYLPDVGTESMYGEIARYKSLAFYKDHPIITFNSVHENGRYKVFSVVLFPEGAAPVPYENCLSSGAKEELITLVQKGLDYSLLQLPVEILDNDKILTILAEDPSLQDESGKNAKVLVMARKIREGESDAVDTSAAFLRENPNLPENWYEQIKREQNAALVMEQIRKEAAEWFTEYELSQIDDKELESRLNARKAELKLYLSEQELKLGVDEKLYLYEKRKNEGMKLETEALAARVGDEATLKIEAASVIPNAQYSWKSSDESVVTVKGEGSSAKLTAKKEGKATVTVSFGGLSAQCAVEVKAAAQLVLNPVNKLVYVGNSYNITASEDITGISCSNTGVAHVSYYGKTVTVTAVGVGEATITVTGKNNNSATCKVSVEKEQLRMDKVSITLEKGSRANVYITGGEAVNWYTNNISVIRVSVMGDRQGAQIEAVGVGKTNIVATSRYGTQVSCDVIVTDTGISLSSSIMNIAVGELGDLRVTKGSASKWESSNESIARIYPVGDGSFAQVEGVGSGVATITARASNGSVATCSVSVTKPADALTISPYSMTMGAGEMRNITVTSGSASNWVSSNPAVAQVYVVGDGSMAQVEGISAGTATITIYDQRGGWVNCAVTVQPSVPKLVIGPANIYISEGDWEEITVSSGFAVDWTSSNTDVVKLFSTSDTTKMSIRGDMAGTAQVTAYGSDGSTAVCNVTVTRVQPEEPVAVPVSISPTSMTLDVGDWGTVTAVTGTAVDWVSTDPSVAGLYDAHEQNSMQIKAVAKGKANIIVYGSDGSTAACEVTVNDPYVEPTPDIPSVKLNVENMTLTVGDWAELKLSAGTAEDWSCSNPAVVALFDSHETNTIRLRADSEGTAQIIVYGAGNSKAVCNITVNPYVAPPEEIVTAEPEPEVVVPDVPAQEAPAQEEPAQEAPAQEAPAQEEPVQEEPAQETQETQEG